MGFYDNLPGYENPLGKNAPSWKGDFDWKGGSKGIDWGSGFDIDKSGLFEKLFDKTKQTDKWQREGQYGFQNQKQSPWAWGGEWSPGQGGQIGTDAFVYKPPQMAPVFIAGVEGKRGLGGTIGSVLGGIGGALIGGPVGAAIGAAGGPIGSLFG